MSARFEESMPISRAEDSALGPGVDDEQLEGTAAAPRTEARPMIPVSSGTTGGEE